MTTREGTEEVRWQTARYGTALFQIASFGERTPRRAGKSCAMGERIEKAFNCLAYIERLRAGCDSQTPQARG